MKDVSNVLSYLQGKTGLEPIAIVKIAWGAPLGTVKYAKKVPTGHTVEAKLVSIGDLVTSISNKVFGQIQSISMTLFDDDEALRVQSENGIIEGKSCEVYIGYEGISEGDENLIFKGVIEGPFNWSEGDRTLSFTALSKWDHLDAGVILDASTLSGAPYSSLGNLDPNIEDSLVPMILGAVVDAQTLRITRQYEAVLTEPVYISHHEEGSDDSTQVKVRTIDEKEDIFYGYTLGSITKLEINGHIIGVSYVSTLNGIATFNILGTYDTGLNPYKYSQYELGTAPTANSFGTPITGARDANDPDYNNPKVFWLAKNGFHIENQFVLLSSPWSLWNKCEKQEGRKCYFKYPWTWERNYTDANGNHDEWVPMVVHANKNVLEVRSFATSSIYTTMRDAAVDDDRKIKLDGGAKCTVWFENDTYEYGLAPEVYLINSEGTSFLNSVKARRSGDGLDGAFLYEVPFTSGVGVPTYYNEALDWESTGISAITLPVPLSYYPNEGWGDEIFCTHLSSVEGGTYAPADPWGNVATIIEHLIDTYGGSYTSDATTFAAVEALVADEPASFAIYDSVGLMELLGSIAWQARCGLVLDGSNIKIKYLAQAPGSGDLSLDGTNIEVRSMELSWPETVDLVTQVKYFWHPTDARERLWRYITQNEDIVGNKEEWDFQIYNIESLADDAAKFWLNRYANIWRRLTVTCFMDSIGAEIFDIIDLDLSGTIGNHLTITDASIYCNLLQTAWSIEQNRITMTLELPCHIGDQVADSTYWVGV